MYNSYWWWEKQNMLRCIKNMLQHVKQNTQRCVTAIEKSELKPRCAHKRWFGCYSQRSNFRWGRISSCRIGQLCDQELCLFFRFFSFQEASVGKTKPICCITVREISLPQHQAGQIEGSLKPVVHHITMVLSDFRGTLIGLPICLGSSRTADVSFSSLARKEKIE